LEADGSALPQGMARGSAMLCTTDDRRALQMERFNISMRKYLKEVGVTSQQAIEEVVREENLAGKGTLKVKMVLTGEGTGLKHVVEGEIELPD
jgi:hypothetical protein